MPQTTINKGISDLRKRLNACVFADGGHFDYVNCVVALLIWHNFIKIGNN